MTVNQYIDWQCVQNTSVSNGILFIRSMEYVRNAGETFTRAVQKIMVVIFRKNAEKQRVIIEITQQAKNNEITLAVKC